METKTGLVLSQTSVIKYTVTVESLNVFFEKWMNPLQALPSLFKSISKTQTE